MFWKEKAEIQLAAFSWAFQIIYNFKHLVRGWVWIIKAYSISWNVEALLPAHLCFRKNVFLLLLGAVPFAEDFSRNNSTRRMWIFEYPYKLLFIHYNHFFSSNTSLFCYVFSYTCFLPLYDFFCQVEEILEEIRTWENEKRCSGFVI